MEICMGDRTIPMALTTFEMIAIQEEFGCTVGQLQDEVFGLEKNMETDEYTFLMLDDKDRLRKFGTLIRILGNAGLEEAGQNGDLTDKWVLRHMPPHMIAKYMVDVTRVMNEAMKQEAGKKNGDGPVDEVLEEENRKKEQESLPTGGSSPAD